MGITKVIMITATCLAIMITSLIYYFPYIMLPSYYRTEFYFVDGKIEDRLNVATSGGHEVIFIINSTNQKEASADLNNLPPDSCNGEDWLNIKIIRERTTDVIPMQFFSRRSTTVGHQTSKAVCKLSLAAGRYDISSKISDASIRTKYKSIQLRVRPSITK
jgi:hypothetical protein